MRHAIKRESDGLIVNVINLPPEANFTPPAGHSLVSEEIQPMEIGGTFVGNVYTPPKVEDVGMKAIIARAIQSLRPGAAWILQGDTLAGLTWTDPVLTRPTNPEINAEVARLQGLDGAETTRANSFKADAGRVDLMTRLKTATPAQIDTWVDANVTTLPQARTVLKAIIKVIALDSRT